LLDRAVSVEAAIGIIDGQKFVRRAVPILLLAAWSSLSLAWGQLRAPNEVGVIMGRVHASWL